MNCKLTTTSSRITNPPTQSTRLHSHPTITDPHLSLTNPSSFYPSSSHSKHQPFSFRTNSLGGYNINFFDITKAQKYFKHNSSSKTPRFNLISKQPLITNPKTPLTKQQNMTSRNFSFSNNKPSKPSYIQIINKHKPITPKHNHATTTTTTVKSKHMYTPVYKKVNNQRYCSGSSSNNKNKNKKLTSLSDNNINANGCNDNWGKEYKKYMTIACGEKGKKVKVKVKVKDNDDVVTADVISAKERRKAILNGEDLKRRRSDNAGGKDEMRKSNEIKTKHLGNGNGNSNKKKKYLSINTNVTVDINSNSSNNNKYISKTPKTKTFGLSNNNNNKHITPNTNNNANNEYLYTDVLYSFNSITNTIGNQTQTHFKNKYRNLFETYFSSGTITTTCIPTSHI